MDSEVFMYIKVNINIDIYMLSELSLLKCVCLSLWFHKIRLSSSEKKKIGGVVCSLGQNGPSFILLYPAS